MTGPGLYVHIPFCASKCSYCTFNSYPYERLLAEKYVHALSACEARRVAAITPDTMYIGGGTPTVVEPALLALAVKALSSAYRLPAGAELTLEANPCTLSGYDLTPLLDAGVNRVSLGAQSFDESELRLLGRAHSPGDTDNSVALLRSYGIDNLGMDLIYGLPGQNIDKWSRSLERAAGLGPEHLSVYCLSIEEGTPLYRETASGRLEPASEEHQADMYEFAVEMLEAAGYARYEISNFALDGRECGHNLNYWRAGDFLGIGAGAHSSIGRVRSANLSGVEEYITAVTSGREPAGLVELISDEEAEKEYIMLSLRTREGLSFDEYSFRFGREFMALHADEVARLEGIGCVICGRDGIRLSGRGMMSSNPVVAELF